jgi:hypothetical protein
MRVALFLLLLELRGTPLSQCDYLYSPPLSRASSNGCGGPWWNVSRSALNLMENILRPYYKCTVSAITHKLSVCGYMLIWTFFLALVFGTHAPSLSALSIYTLYSFKHYKRGSIQRRVFSLCCFIVGERAPDVVWDIIGNMSYLE